MPRSVRLHEASARPTPARGEFLRDTTSPAAAPGSSAVARTAAAFSNVLCRLLRIAPRQPDFEHTRPLVRDRLESFGARANDCGAARETTWLADVDVREIEIGEDKRRSLFGALPPRYLDAASGDARRRA